MAIPTKGRKMAKFDKRFGNTQGNKTKNGGMTTTGMGMQAGAPSRAKKVSGSKHR